jgi:Xaa-Pro aminopeptidase
VGRSSIPVTFYEYLSKNIIGSKFVDVTDQIDQIKVIKSSEEIELIKRTAELQDVSMEHVRKSIRPGLRDFEIFAEAQYSVVKQGSERQVIHIGSASPGTPARWQFRHFQNRMIREGDQLSVLIEVSGPGGYYTEIGRMFSLGRPSQEFQDAFGVAVEAQKITLNLLKPGANPKDIWDANNEFLEKNGYAPERRLYAHGQGYDFVERPAIRYDEPMKIRAGMNITVHPFAIRPTVWAAVCDNYLVTESGIGPCLHKTAKEIIVV